jgi:hypothetical protein
MTLYGPILELLGRTPFPGGAEFEAFGEQFSTDEKHSEADGLPNPAVVRGFILFAAMQCTRALFSLCLAVSLSLFLSVSLCFPVPTSPCVSASLRLCVSLSPCLPVSCLPVALSLCLPVSLSLSISLSLFLFLFLCRWTLKSQGSPFAVAMPAHTTHPPDWPSSGTQVLGSCWMPSLMSSTRHWPTSSACSRYASAPLPAAALMHRAMRRVKMQISVCACEWVCVA